MTVGGLIYVNVVSRETVVNSFRRTPVPLRLRESSCADPARRSSSGALTAIGWPLLAKFDGEISSTTNVYVGSGVVRKEW